MWYWASLIACAGVQSRVQPHLHPAPSGRRDACPPHLASHHRPKPQLQNPPSSSLRRKPPIAYKHPAALLAVRMWLPRQGLLAWSLIGQRSQALAEGESRQEWMRSMRRRLGIPLEQEQPSVHREVKPSRPPSAMQAVVVRPHVNPRGRGRALQTSQPMPSLRATRKPEQYRAPDHHQPRLHETAQQRRTPVRIRPRFNPLYKRSLQRPHMILSSLPIRGLRSGPQ